MKKEKPSPFTVKPSIRCSILSKTLAKKLVGKTSNRSYKSDQEMKRQHLLHARRIFFLVFLTFTCAFENTYIFPSSGTPCMTQQGEGGELV